PQTRSELNELMGSNNTQVITARLCVRLEMGNAGLRGVLGAGPEGMRRLVVIQTAVGLAAYLRQTLPDIEKRGVVIGYDGRHKSKEFAEDSAALFISKNIPVHLFNVEVPTPVVAFATVQTRAGAGIMV